jgi:predicted DNA-binding transcriptional regulator AlpA
VASNLIGTAEVGRMLGVTRQRVHQLRAEHKDFPSPALEHPRAAFWKARDIERWATKHGYTEKEG